MVDLLPPVENVAQRAVESILDTISNQDILLPPCVLIDDGRGDWRSYAASLPVEARRRSVIAALSDTTLVDAVRYELGGAIRLPVSTPSLGAACEIAASNDQPGCAPFATFGVLEMMLADATELWVVGWRPQSFWHRQVGPSRLCRFLTAVASRLRCAPVILPGPVLLTVDRRRSEVIASCRDEHEAGSTGCPEPPSVWDGVAALNDENPAVRVEGVLAGRIDVGGGEGDRLGTASPVLDLSTGRRVGGWSASAMRVATGTGFVAHPPGEPTRGGVWEFVDESGSSHVLVETTSFRDQERSSQTVIRVPGFIGAALRPGSPAGLLVERLAHDERRVSRTLWVPSVDAPGVQFLLRLPGPIWVDGPGVPG